LRRFFIDAPLAGSITINGQDAHHISRVLRMVTGDVITVANKAGQAARARLTSIRPEAVVLDVINLVQQHSEPPIEVWLAQGLPKSDKMEFIVQKAVEMGAAGIIPMAVDFSTVRYDDVKQRAKVERWQKIAKEAAKQCGRDLVPTVTPVIGLKEVLAGVAADTVVIMLYEGQAGIGLKTILAQSKEKAFLLIVGPEGGFSAGEYELCREHGAQIATLGPRILRTETASLAALAITMYQHGDLG
jgi:16S rRNA (uracil1498-N3)-methyltransferase